MSLSTSCRDCVFAVYEGNAQTGCRLGRLEKYQERGVILERQYDVDQEELARMFREEEAAQSYLDRRQELAVEQEFQAMPRLEGGKEFFFLHNRICTACRNANSPWVEEHSPDTWKDQVELETRLKVHVLVLVGPDSTVEQVRTTLESLHQQKHLPGAVHLVVNTPHLKSFQLLQVARHYSPSLSTQVRVIFERNEDGSRVSPRRMIDLTVLHLEAKRGSFYLTLPAGKRLPPHFLSELDRHVNQELKQFILVEPAVPLEGLLVSLRMHRLVKGNEFAEHEEEDGSLIRCDTVEKKIHLMARDDESQHLCRSLEEFSLSCD